VTLDGIEAILAAAHFIRPLWLLALAPVALLWWRIRRSAQRGMELPAVIAPHLAAALTVGSAQGSRLKPIDGVALVLAFLVIGAAGPTWSRVPNPLVSDTAPLAIVLKVAASMNATDVPPSRLERAKHKVLDLIAARAGARTALIAYAGTAHQVVPPTEDPEVIKPFLEGLEPRVMPSDGEAARSALLLAQEVLNEQDAPGAILFLLDRITDADGTAFAKHAAEEGAPVLFWHLGRGGADREKLAAVPQATVIDLTADNVDVGRVITNIETAYLAALARDERQKWQDRGALFTWPAALLLLFWFRKGWTMRWSVILLSAGLTLPATPARADGWRDWFLTPDQQGRLAFEKKEYQQAADRFEDPMWKARSLYRLGKYQEAAEIYAWQESAEAALGEGLSLIRTRAYRPAITAFEKAVARDPAHAAARHNLALAQHILAYIETTREQSDTGEESGIGADDVVFDNEAARGTDTQQPAATDTETRPETAEQWMRTVDTRTGDFLKSRFALEAARQGR